MPAQPIPETASSPADEESVLAQVVEQMDVRQQVDGVAQLVSRYLTGGGDSGRLMETLGHLMLREDSEFHSFQLIDAGLQQYKARQGTNAGRHVLIGVARFLAAHAPTPRAVGQTYQIALRLHRGEELYSDI